MAKSSKKSRNRDRRRSVPAGPSPDGRGSVDQSGKSDKPDKPGWCSQVVIRESIEAVAIAFILAFLFRTFEAEAFVIPTGSMATTLMGRHKDVECPMCGYGYQVSASNGLDAQGAVVEGVDVLRATCPMCGYEKDARDDRPYNGDRILVNKFVYCFEDPQRWDVAVFKYPEGAKTNFIKRVVGLPNETIRIHRGDIYVRKDSEQEFSIVRKQRPEKLRAMLQLVYDNDRVLPEKLLAQGWPARWQPADAAQGWVVSDDYKSFSTDGSSGGEAWLRYRHYRPTDQDWKAIGRGGLPLGYQPKAQLISDFCAYNAGVDGRRDGSAYARSQSSGLHWVGDLAVSCTVDVRGAKGRLAFELVEGGRQMQCRIDLATGQAELTIPGETFRAVGQTAIAKPGTYEIMFSNVDNELRLWVDDKVVAFDGPTTYGPLGNVIPQEADLAPVGIATTGADVQVSHLKVWRDLYYIAVKSTDDWQSPPMWDYRTPYNHFDQYITPQSVAEFLSTPSAWPEAFSEASMNSVEFPLTEDQFLMLGDNSAQSKDSRLWGKPEYYVARELLIGKALFIYWPHSWHKITGTGIPFPFFPNFKRMEFVR